MLRYFYLQDFSIPLLYSQYHAFIDFILYVFIFVSIAQLTIGKRFTGRPGRVLAGATGLVLAISLAIAGESMGFSIKSFGVYAAGLIIILMFLIVFQFFKAMGAGIMTAGSIDIVVIFLLTMFIVPEFFQWILDIGFGGFFFPIFWVAILIILFKISSIPSVVNRGKQLNAEAGKLRFPKFRLPQILFQKGREFREEKKVFKENVLKSTNKEKKVSKEIIFDLKNMRRAISRQGITPGTKAFIAKKINEIVPRDQELFLILKNIKDINTRLKKVDLSVFEALSRQYDSLTEQDKALFRKELVAEKEKIVGENRLIQLTDAVKQYEQEFMNFLSMAVKEIDFPQKANAWINKAIEKEKGALKLLSEMKSLERRLIDITSTEIKDL